MNLKEKHRLGRSHFAFAIWLVPLLVLGFQATANADEITLMRFRTKPVSEQAVVKLGDLVEVTRGSTPDIQSAMQLTLGPAPRVGSAQTWHAQDILQHLELRGIHLDSIQWSGEAQTQLQRIDPKMVNVTEKLLPAFMSQHMVEQAQANVAAAIDEYISLKTGETTQWEIDAEIDFQHVKALNSRRTILSVGGGSESLMGKQTFLLKIKTDNGPQTIQVKANVELPPMVVVASRPIRRDEVLTAEALKMKSLPRSKLTEGQYFSNFDNLIGKQMRRSLSTGMPVSEEIIGDPVVISRGQLVTVECVSGGIAVSSSAKAITPGAIGELIQVEMVGRQRVSGTVISPLIVRIAAKATNASGGLQ